MLLVQLVARNAAEVSSIIDEFSFFNYELNLLADHLLNDPAQNFTRKRIIRNAKCFDKRKSRSNAAHFDLRWIRNSVSVQINILQAGHRHEVVEFKIGHIVVGEIQSFQFVIRGEHAVVDCDLIETEIERFKVGQAGKRPERHHVIIKNLIVRQIENLQALDVVGPVDAGPIEGVVVQLVMRQIYLRQRFQVHENLRRKDRNLIVAQIDCSQIFGTSEHIRRQRDEFVATQVDFEEEGNAEGEICDLVELRVAQVDVFKG